MFSFHSFYFCKCLFFTPIAHQGVEGEGISLLIVSPKVYLLFFPVIVNYENLLKSINHLYQQQKMTNICRLQLLNFAAFLFYIIVTLNTFGVWTVGQTKNKHLGLFS